MRQLIVLLTACKLADPAPVASPGYLAPKQRDGSADQCSRLPPTGTPADYVAPSISGFVIHAPAMCVDEAYVRVERTHGSRTLGTGRAANGGFSEGCTTLPANPGDPAACPVVNALALMQAALPTLRERSIGATGPGGGVCADTSGDYDAWNMSLSVLSWKQVEPVIRELTVLMDRYDTRGAVGVSVAGIPCVELLGAPRSVR